MPRDDDSSLAVDFELTELEYDARFGRTFDQWAVWDNPELMRKAIAGMKKALESGEPVTNKSLGIRQITDPNIDL